MCGIAGFLDRRSSSGAERLQQMVSTMTGTLLHRGPDDGGMWVEPSAGVALGHRRLAILDLSPEGHQPMACAGGHQVMVFNGEIYNFLDLKTELQAHGHRFRGGSDTEVMLAAFEQWGVEASLKRFNGMFAFALWDKRTRTLTLGRDRLGKKPLYYGWQGQTLLFGSELKALCAHPAFHSDLDRGALALYFRFGYIPAPHTIYKGIFKLPAGTFLTIGPGDSGSASPVSYWSARELAEQGLANRHTNYDEAISELQTLLSDAVGIRMISDVPLGAFLSGGIDSSLVVALMQARSSSPVKTFCIGFAEATHNEATHAQAVAQHLGTDHTELILTPADTLNVVPKLPAMFDEPMSDSSQIPTFLVCELARRHVTVSLSGDGGDELFAGYTAYTSAARHFTKYSWIPGVLKSAGAAGLRAVPEAVWDRLIPGDGVKPSGARVHRLAVALSQTGGAEAVYRNLMSIWEDPKRLLRGVSEPPVPHTMGVARSIPVLEEKMMLLDALAYLPDDILVKVDRASMAVSLEARAPLLDYRLFELAWRIPLSFKQRNGTGKWILRDLLYRYVPRQLVDRPKSGFAVPVSSWLRGPLRSWGEDLLSDSRLKQQGLLDSAAVRHVWDQHQQGADWGERLWNIIVLQQWLESRKESAANVLQSAG